MQIILKCSKENCVTFFLTFRENIRLGAFENHVKHGKFNWSNYTVDDMDGPSKRSNVGLPHRHAVYGDQITRVWIVKHVYPQRTVIEQTETKHIYGCCV